MKNSLSIANLQSNNTQKKCAIGINTIENTIATVELQPETVSQSTWSLEQF